MQGRSLLQTLITNFSIENLTNFFQNVNESFTPSHDDYSHFVDDGAVYMPRTVCPLVWNRIS